MVRLGSAPREGKGTFLVPKGIEGERGEEGTVLRLRTPHPALTPATSKFIHHEGPHPPVPRPGQSSPASPGPPSGTVRATYYPCPPSLSLGSALGRQVKEVQVHMDHKRV